MSSPHVCLVVDTGIYYRRVRSQFVASATKIFNATFLVVRAVSADGLEMGSDLLSVQERFAEIKAKAGH